MPQYVYALHDFLPEHEDEVSFRAGERIEVVERDDVYGDGWWQGRNLAGKVGLFPVSYTTPAAPTSGAPYSTSETVPTNGKTSLQTLAEESESESPSILSPVPKQPPIPSFLSNCESDEYDRFRDDTSSLHLAPAQDGEVMAATMTDVQKAIEQLGRGGIDGDGSRSFSFASSRDADTDEADFDMSDLDTVPDDGGEDWHKNARMKLAARAKRAVEEAEKLETMTGNAEDRRSLVPPIDAELSDESDGEEGDYTRSKFPRRPFTSDDESVGLSSNGLGHIKEESKGSDTDVATPSVGVTELTIPPKEEDDLATATKSTFPGFSPPTTATPLRAAAASPPPLAMSATVVPEPQRSASPTKAAYPTPISPAVPTAIQARSPTPGSRRSSLQQQTGLPSPSPSSHFGSSITNGVSKHHSIPSTSSATAVLPPVAAMPVVISPPVSVPQEPAQAIPEPAADVTSLRAEAKKASNASEWSVEEVVEWLKSKRFDQDVCDKFVEQEITGDVLLELDVNLLKSELGIMAFGKRVRIANAIADLRRPASIHSSEHSPSPAVLASFPTSQTHSRTQSQGQVSHHSFPGATSLLYAQSVQSSLNSPMTHAFEQQAYAHQDAMLSTPLEHEETKMNGISASASAPGTMKTAASYSVGLGIGGVQTPTTPPANKTRYNGLQTSPSDGALKHSATKTGFMKPPTIQHDEDRGHMSDGDVHTTSAVSARRRLFGRSHDSTISTNPSKASRESPLPSPTTQTSDTSEKGDKDRNSLRDSISIGSGRHKMKKSVDAKAGDRLSIFGGTFAGSLGKGRKPVPNMSGESGEKTPKFSLPRLHGTPSMRKASSQSTTQQATPAASPKDLNIIAPFHANGSEREKPATLRKRSGSGLSPVAPTSTLAAVDGAAMNGQIKQGQNIWEQIGEPDYEGWMRKKGERYNAWKLRYFILKGPHLYWMRSNSKTETKLKGYLHITGYKVTVDESIDPGRYGFRIEHDHDKPHFFSSEDKMVVREWMKAIMKATIGRDYSKPVVSSCNIPTIPLVVAQAMNPAPRPPSPMARDATQKAMRRENPDQLSKRDAEVLMGLPNDNVEQQPRPLEELFPSNGRAGPYAPAPISQSNSRQAAPPRPSREHRRSNSTRTDTTLTSEDSLIVDWANGHLPPHLQIFDPSGPLCTGLGVLRIAESIKGKPSSPPVPDNAFPVDPRDDKLDGLFRLFDFLLDNDVKMGSVSINDIRQGNRDKILQLLKALRAWEDKRKALEQSFGRASTASATGGFMVPLTI